jgi:hypothetical protein
LKCWLIHMDNTRPQNSRQAQKCVEASRAECLPHPADSLASAPSDFSFLDIYRYQRKLSDCNYESQEDLRNATTEISIRVDQKVLLSVFESWVNRLKWVIKHEEKYCTKSREKKKHSFEIDKENRRTGTYGPLYFMGSKFRRNWTGMT